MSNTHNRKIRERLREAAQVKREEAVRCNLVLSELYMDLLAAERSERHAATRWARIDQLAARCS